jgi:hypothetical protein
LNPKDALTTGGAGEYWVLVAAVGAIAVNIGLINGGGLGQFTAESLGLRSGILENYQQNANSKEVFAIVEGSFLPIHLMPAASISFFLRREMSLF